MYSLSQYLDYLERLFENMGSEYSKEFSPHINVWLGVKEDIEIKIINEEIKPGDQVPPLRKLAEMYEISISTAQKVMDDMYHEGTVSRKRGIGYFVKPYVKEKLYKKHKAKFEEMLLKSYQYAVQLNVTESEMSEILKKLKK